MSNQKLRSNHAHHTEANQSSPSIVPELQLIRDPSENHIKEKRLAVIFSSFVALAAGTPYLYGVYSPQLLSRCGFSAISSSYLSFSGNVGSSVGGFFAGLFIDTFGIKAGLVLGALLQFIGFFIFYLNYKYSIHNFFYLIFSMCSIGFGSVLAYFATIKVSTVNFPKHRGLANALPVSSYGLAALFFASISTVWFSNDVQGLLRFIAIFSGLVICASTFFIEIYEDDNEDVDQAGNEDSFAAEDIDFEYGTTETYTTQKLQETIHDIEVGADYLMKGHRGSFAQVSNIIKQNSSSSLFSNISTQPSVTNSLGTSASSSSLTGNYRTKPLSINASGSQNGGNTINTASSSPLEFRSKRSFNRSDSFRLGTPQNSLPRMPKSFGSVTPKHTNDFNFKSETGLSLLPDSNIVGKVSTEVSSVTDTQEDIQSSKNADSALPISNASYGSISALINPGRSTSCSQESLTKTSDENDPTIKNQTSPIKQHITKLFTNKLFISHYILNAIYCAIGQNYIYGIGFIVRAQVNSNSGQSILSNSKSLPNSETAVAYQALQVSIISFSNFLGRLIAGPMSDFIHKKHHMNKLYVIIFSLLILLMGQISLIVIDQIEYLGFTSFFIGFSYGAIYATMPSIAADLFGSKNFATTWSLIGTGPISVFLALSNYFGYVYDRQSEWLDVDGEKIRLCLEGKSCYSDVFAATSCISFIILVGYIVTLCMSKHK